MRSPGYPILKNHTRVVSNFMDIDATEMYIIPACSWRGAQKYHGIRFGIGCVVVVEYYAGCSGIWILRVMMREEFVASCVRISA